MKITEELIRASIEENNLLARVVGKEKYRTGSEDSFDQVLERICEFVSRKAEDIYPDRTINEIKYLISEKKIIPAGSILHGLDNDSVRSSLSNCYFTPIEQDSLEGIFDATKKMARTFSYRGGTGIDLTILRPKNTPVDNAAKSSTGAVSFIPTFTEVSKRIGQSGRRGALMIMLDIHHPDIIDFIDCKSDPARVFGSDPITGEVHSASSANISVKITDDFMQAVENDEPWKLIFPSTNMIQGVCDEENKIKLHPVVFEVLDPQVHDSIIVKNQSYTITEVDLKEKSISIDADGSELCPYDEPIKVIFSHATKDDPLRPTKRVYDRLWNGDYNMWLKYLDQIAYVYAEIQAKELIRKIAESSHACGDPGVFFSDIAIADNPASVIHPALIPRGVNPCGEQPLPQHGNCCLIAVAMHRFVKNPWKDNAEFDFDAFSDAIRSAVYFQDLIIDENINRHPLKEQQMMDQFSRRIGVEPTGIADMLAMLGIRYGGNDSIIILEKIMKLKITSEIKASAALAKLRGCCDAMVNENSRERLVSHDFFKRLDLDDKTVSQIKENGLRNCAWSTAGPCGSISIMAGNCTSGIEPLYAFSYKRKTQFNNGTAIDLIHPVAALHIIENIGNFDGMTFSQAADKLNYVPSQNLDYLERIKVQEIIQYYTDSGVSSTINLPSEVSIDTITDIYVQAWKARLKGITVFRDGCKSGVLELSSHEKELKSLAPYELVLNDIEKSYRHRVVWMNAKLYIIVSVDSDKKPIEIFTKLPRTAGMDSDGVYSEGLFQERYSLWDTVCRLTSLLLRQGTPVARVVEQMDESSYSIVDAAGIIARILKNYVTSNGNSDEENSGLCPICGQESYIRENGCQICKACGYSVCN